MPIKIVARGQRAAEIAIDGQIGQDFWGEGITAKKFRADLEALGDLSEILVRINSPGGEVFDGFSIYNALKEHPAKVTVSIDGLAASIASVIAMAGDTVTMGLGAMVMVHAPWTLAAGNADNMRSTAELLDKVQVGLVDAYVAKTGLSRAKVEAWMDGETWFTRAEAIDAGLADAASDDTHDAVVDPAQTAATWTPFKAAASAQFHAFAAALNSTPPRTAAALNQSASADAQETTMPNQAQQSAPNAGIQDVTEAVQAALRFEATRQQDIRSRFGRFAGEHRELLDTCLADQAITPDAASQQLLARLGEGAEPLGGPRIVVDARDKFRTGASAALMARAGLGARDPSNEFNGLTLADLAGRALDLSGVSIRGLTRDGIARRVLASHTTSDFPNLLSSTAGKVLRDAYGAFPNTWRAWCAVGQVSDFKIHPRIQLGAFNDMAVIAEGGEYTYGTLGEAYENAQAATKGKAIALTRQMIVNDDLSGFTRRAQLMGSAAARTVNTDVYAYLTSGASNHGPTSSDTGQFFNATAVTTAGGHANLTSSGTAISVTSLGVGRTAMRKQKDVGLKTTLNIMPKILLTTVGKEDLAKEIVTSTTKDGQSNSNQPNVLRNAFEVVSDPYLDGISATAWYLLAATNDPAAALEVVFLDGNETPFIDEMVDFDTDAMKFKIRLDYGVAIGDWRGGYKNVGA